jgi:flavin reductase (DIM6/NTAB) family NADH-FMN oxidoreductase RutF
MKKKSFPVSKAYQLIEPGPVIMVTTQHKDKQNVMTMAWHMMVEFEPALVAFIMSEDNYSFDLLKKSKQCIINIPTVDMIKTAVDIGSCTGAKVDKFKKFGLTKKPASVVDVPLIDECYANLECKVVDMKLVSKYNLFIVEVVKAWITTSKARQRTIHHCGNGVFVVDGEIVKLRFKSIS